MKEKRQNTYWNPAGKGLSIAEIMKRLRLNIHDRHRIVSYAKSNGINDVQTLEELTDYIDKNINLSDAHDFSYRDFLVTTSP